MLKATLLSYSCKINQACHSCRVFLTHIPVWLWLETFTICAQNLLSPSILKLCLCKIQAEACQTVLYIYQLCYKQAAPGTAMYSKSKSHSRGFIVVAAVQSASYFQFKRFLENFAFPILLQVLQEIYYSTIQSGIRYASILNCAKQKGFPIHVFSKGKDELETKQKQASREVQRSFI